MKNVDILKLNQAIAEIKVSGDGITRDARTKLILSKVELSKMVKNISEFRETLVNSEMSDEQKTQTFNDFLNEETDINIKKLTDDEIDAFAACSSLNVDQLELIYTYFK